MSKIALYLYVCVLNDCVTDSCVRGRRTFTGRIVLCCSRVRSRRSNDVSERRSRLADTFRFVCPSTLFESLFLFDLRVVVDRNDRMGLRSNITENTENCQIVKLSVLFRSLYCLPKMKKKRPTRTNLFLERFCEQKKKDIL